MELVTVVTVLMRSSCAMMMMMMTTTMMMMMMMMMMMTMMMMMMMMMMMVTNDSVDAGRGPLYCPRLSHPFPLFRCSRSPRLSPSSHALLPTHSSALVLTRTRPFRLAPSQSLSVHPSVHRSGILSLGPLFSLPMLFQSCSAPLFQASMLDCPNPAEQQWQLQCDAVDCTSRLMEKRDLLFGRVTE